MPTMRSMPSASTRPNLLINTLHDIAATALRRRAPQLSPHQVEQAVAEIAEALCSRLGRRDMYLPSAEAARRARRDREIRQAYERAGPDGAQARSAARALQLAQHHGLSARRVRAILAADGSALTGGKPNP